ncbi:MAG: methyltransferase domain-containing protein [Rhodobacteraceae bacterium]|nr:methyltransferase domain-containing protein [Paracoccaceae bacterium]
MVLAQNRDGKDLLEGAYDLSTPGDSIAYYKDFAAVYDADFVASLGYVFPKILAEFYHQTSGPKDAPVADIGCGTGLVAEALKLPRASIDGFDISQEMLDVSARKKLYYILHLADLTAAENLPEKEYGAVISAGTFTHGHLGPEPLRNLLALARPKGLFCIGVNAVHFRQAGFGTVLDDMQNRGLITSPQISEVEIYQNQDHAHSQDRALILQYRKAG